MIQEKAHYPGLDALRGIAIILVILFHYFAFPIGWIGVDLFFVLSGFLITDILLRTKESEHYFRNFFLRRMLRIFPVYFLVIGTFFVLSPFVFSEKGPGTVYTYYSEHQAWFWTFMQNWLFITKGLPPEPFLQHFWSLAVEEQFYLLWPFLLYRIKSHQLLQWVLPLIFISALGFRTWLWLNSEAKDIVYYNTFARMDSITAGAFLALIHNEKNKIYTYHFVFITSLFILMLLAVVLIEKSWRHDTFIFATIGYSVVAIFFMALCHYMRFSASVIATNKLLRFTGRISYGLYIYHVPVLLIVSRVLGRQLTAVLDNSVWRLYAIPVLSCLITLAISIISFRFIELPFLHLKKRLS